MPDAVFIDTWGWLALGHHRDARHQEVKAFYQSLREKGILCYTTDKRSRFYSDGRYLRKLSTLWRESFKLLRSGFLQ